LQALEGPASQEQHVIGLQPVVLPAVDRITRSSEMLSMNALLAPHGHPLGLDQEASGSRPSEELMQCGEHMAWLNHSVFAVAGGSPFLRQQVIQRFGEDRIVPTRREFALEDESPTGSAFETSEMSIVWSLVDFMALSMTHGMIADSDDSMSRAAAMISLYRHSTKGNQRSEGNATGYVFWSTASSKPADRECFPQKTVFQLRNTPQWASPVCLSKEQEWVSSKVLERQRQALMELPLESLNKSQLQKMVWWVGLRDMGKGLMLTVIGGLAVVFLSTIFQRMFTCRPQHHRRNYTSTSK